MPVAPPVFRPPWMPPRSVVSREADQRRGSARARGYDARWEKARLGYLSRHPLCVCCQAHGVVAAAELVDHIVPHKGDRALFWDRGNWQALCAWCHNHVKGVIEARWVTGGVAAAALDLSRKAEGWRGPAGR